LDDSNETDNTGQQASYIRPFFSYTKEKNSNNMDPINDDIGIADDAELNLSNDEDEDSEDTRDPLLDNRYSAAVTSDREQDHFADQTLLVSVHPRTRSSPPPAEAPLDHQLSLVGRQNYAKHGSYIPPQKPPNHPKRFKSSFIFFSIDKYKEIKELMKAEDGPKIKNVTKAVAEAWKNLSREERNKYEDMARRDKERYDLEKANYTPPPGVSLVAKRKREPGAPKRPMSAYISFANQRRAQVKAKNPDSSNGEISKILSERWKGLPDDEKKKYKDMEQAKWDTYKTEMKAWKKKHDGRKKANFHKRAFNDLDDGETSFKRQAKWKSHSADPGVGFNDQLGIHGMDPSGNPNPEEMMAASALRGVRSAPQLMHGQMGDPSQQFSHSHSGYGSWLNSMTGISNNMHGLHGMPMGGMQMNGIGNMFAGAPGNAFQSEMANFPYNQQFSSNPMGTGNQQAMMMAQFRAAQSPYANYFSNTDQQANLSQLASLAGSQQNNSLLLTSNQDSQGTNLNSNMNSNETAGDGSLLNDHSGGNVMHQFDDGSKKGGLFSWKNHEDSMK
jgi:high mobility group protein B1